MITMAGFGGLEKTEPFKELKKGTWIIAYLQNGTVRARIEEKGQEGLRATLLTLKADGTGWTHASGWVKYTLTP